MNLTCNNSWASIRANFSNEFNQSVSANLPACSETAGQSPSVIDPLEDFYKAAFGSSIFIYVVSFITILANSLLLLIFCVDPLKIFRNPTTYFLIGLAIVDLLTALVQEPIYATCFMFVYFQHPLRKKCQPLANAGRRLGAFAMTASFLIVFAFTVTQYIVVSSPLKYGRLVTKRKVLFSIAVIYLYSAIFWCLHLMGVSPNVQNIMDSFIHDYLLVFITIAFYILLHRAMKKKMTAGKSLQSQTGKRDNSKHVRVQRNFVRVNFMLLAVLIMCNMPSAVMWTVKLFMVDQNATPVKTLIANLMVDNLLYLKFLLDPFVYAWRVPKYRTSLSKIVCCKNTGKESNRNGNGSESKLSARKSLDGELSTVELNKSVITLLSFKTMLDSSVIVK
ncbi:melanopsin-B-like [Orbicella faveolata]|uniref:melanopsin-B-like n=1 Tax=Orbicella faveolata TaxID=48498 RepID=UPI0009E38D3B|nr:melanopsin-B-like [Orbicella faveolata]